MPSTIPSTMATTVGTTNSRAITLWVIADTRFDLPPCARCHLPLSRGIVNLQAWNIAAAIVQLRLSFKNVAGTAGKNACCFIGSLPVERPARHPSLAPPQGKAGPCPKTLHAPKSLHVPKAFHVARFRVSGDASGGRHGLSR